MKVLLDTNIIIHREASKAINQDKERIVLIANHGQNATEPPHKPKRENRSRPEMK